MEAELVLTLEDADWDSIEDLIRRCNAADGSNYSTEPDGDFFYLVRNGEPEESGIAGELLAVLFGYRLGETEEGQEVLELCAYTLPEARQLGCFTLCLHALQDDFRGYSFRFLTKPRHCPEAEAAGAAAAGQDSHPCAEDGYSCAEDRHPCAEDITPEGQWTLPEDTRETLKALGAEQLYDELFLMKTLPRGIADPGESLCSRFGEVFFSRFNDDTLYLYGLLVYERYQRQGHGREILERLEAQPEGPYRQILLQVSSRNRPALSLYRALSYETREMLSYWKI